MAREAGRRARRRPPTRPASRSTATRSRRWRWRAASCCGSSGNASSPGRELLARLERVLPAEVRLARLSPRFDEKGEVTLDLSLVGPGNASVVRTVAALSRNPAFESVDLRTETSPEMGVPEGYSFQLAIRYRPEGPEKPARGTGNAP